MRKLTKTFIFFLLISDLVSAADCALVSNYCIESSEVRNINGLDVYQDCWKEKFDYECAATDLTLDSYCTFLSNSGCSPFGQTCDDTGCIQQYECADPDAQTTISTENCTSQNVSIDNSLVDGSSLSFDTGYEKNGDFGKAAAALGMIEEIGTDGQSTGVDCGTTIGLEGVECSGTIDVFVGEELKCQTDDISFSNCCKQDGWGQSLGLAQCSSEELKLGYARKAKTTHYVGDYCSGYSGSVFKWCYQTKEVFCNYKSLLGRLIQEQGRSQLGVGWGGAETPHCRGLTQLELMQIDFSVMDFSEFFGTAHSGSGGAPTDAQMNAIIQDYMNRQQGTP